MMGVWCFYSGMGRRLRCEKSSSPVGEIRQGCFFCHNSSPQLQNPSPLGNFPTPWKQSNKAAFSLLFPLQNPLNFIKSNRHPSKNANYRLLFEKTLSYRLHFRLRKQKIMHPIFGVHDFYIVSSKIRLWKNTQPLIQSCTPFAGGVQTVPKGCAVVTPLPLTNPEHRIHSFCLLSILHYFSRKVKIKKQICVMLQICFSFYVKN